MLQIILVKTTINIGKTRRMRGRKMRSMALMTISLRRSAKATRRMILIRGVVLRTDLEALVAPVRAVDLLAVALEGAGVAAALDHPARASPTFLATTVASPTSWTCHGR